MLNINMLGFTHTAGIHLGKAYRNSSGGAERYEGFFRCLSGSILAPVLREGGYDN